ncbi:MAG: class I SAM-dependent methyltransferase [Hyphomicrobium sp.]|nr:class I SAM-dependent methyltransferase [Hyphomicrobium sp.]
MSPELIRILACPRCAAPISTRPRASEPAYACSNPRCQFYGEGFPVFDGKPALIDFDDSVMTRDSIAQSAAEQAIETRPGLKERLRGFVMAGDSSIGEINCLKFLNYLRKIANRPRVLIVGGGSRGSGLDVLYDAPDVEVIGTDIYVSDNVALLADGHHLPFVDRAFDGVVIQAVLEHVLDPPQVVAEIHRVLKPDGLIYAETPFMQQVHMAAFDFTRFTPSGHRWLFKNFAQLDAGTNGGPGLSLFWSIRYFMRSLVRSDKVATALTLPFFWLRFADKWAGGHFAGDGANGVYFIGRRAERTLRPRQMISYYNGTGGIEALDENLETEWPSATITKPSGYLATPASRN